MIEGGASRRERPGRKDPAVGWTSFQRRSLAAINDIARSSSSASMAAEMRLSSRSICLSVRWRRASSGSGARILARAAMSRSKSSAFSRASRASRDWVALRCISLALSGVMRGASVAGLPAMREPCGGIAGKSSAGERGSCGENQWVARLSQRGTQQDRCLAKVGQGNNCLNLQVVDFVV